MLLKHPLKNTLLLACLNTLFVLLLTTHTSAASSKADLISEDLDSPEKITVLYLMGEQAPLEWHQSFRRGFKNNLTKYINDFNVKEITYSMHLSMSELSLEDQINYLEEKFSGHTIDYIISDVSSTQRAIDQHPDFFTTHKKNFLFSKQYRYKRYYRNF